MSTNSYIGIANPDKTVDYIYCHWDGYLSHNGTILNDHYQDAEKIRHLISEGDASFIAPEIGEKHNFDDIPKGMCRFYRRDRGDNVPARKVENMEDLLKDHLQDVYLYEDGKWTYHQNHQWQLLVDCLKEIGKPIITS